MKSYARMMIALASGRAAGLIRDAAVSALMPVAIVPYALTMIRWINVGRSSVSDTALYPLFRWLKENPARYTWATCSLAVGGIALSATSLAMSEATAYLLSSAAVCLTLTLFAFVVCACVREHETVILTVALFLFNAAVFIGAMLFLAMGLKSYHLLGIVTIVLSITCALLIYVISRKSRSSHPQREGERTSLIISLAAPVCITIYVSHLPVLFSLSVTSPQVIPLYWVERIVGSAPGLLSYAIGMSLQRNLHSAGDDVVHRGLVPRCMLLSTVVAALYACLAVSGQSILDWGWVIHGFPIQVKHLVVLVSMSSVVMVENLCLRVAAERPSGAAILLTSSALGYLPVVFYATLAVPAREMWLVTVVIAASWVKCLGLWSLLRFLDFSRPREGRARLPV